LVFRQLALARITEPTSRQDSLRVLEEAGVMRRRTPRSTAACPAWAEETWRQRLSQASPRTPARGPASLVLYGVSALYFEAD
jgi:hypothetical protein